MFRLHHAIAKEKGIKKDAEAALTKAHHAKPELVNGITKTYAPAIEGGEQFPPENQKVQVRVEDVLVDVAAELTKLFDITITKEAGNTTARADIVVDGRALAKDVPVTYLLWLEKRLEDMATFVSKLPILSEAEDWTWDPSQSVFVAKPSMTAKTAKVPTVLEKAPATDKHPAQTEIINIDKTIGHWTTVKRSGALQSDRVRGIQGRVRALREAVKVARETANGTEIRDVAVGRTIFDYLFAHGAAA